MKAAILVDAEIECGEFDVVFLTIFPKAPIKIKHQNKIDFLQS